MSKLLALVLVLSACGDGLNLAPTQRDVLTGVASAFCTRLNECTVELEYGEIDVDYCIEHNEVHLCGDVDDCEVPATSEQLELLATCEEELTVQECTSVVFLGAIPESCSELL